ncbi:uncharacterized protein MONOS_11806 [Monocercomonoides exilis]|uniref:uncharacterized protein n=1 Tax=Monocercomonoides exilis TaxID=2049356 RepID=UPI00355A68F4|nr:hypothetical protein MONOS_11806 [Monocercomonoides exilis]|eukprot:MONOS_11806.1-p1 / transcript=MONOS_11806.1 / gene=MONOS_11806 / organism=Monocercomonoides_exilis_PA203 / gene_product=unspecified product / transcript_product=unspecified product / location=Mono_scaffold00613:32237-33642(-) / protein_length=350 / sequence_SO=supercontig / SO=protein_coding / is_pseudo=false
MDLEKFDATKADSSFAELVTKVENYQMTSHSQMLFGKPDLGPSIRDIVFTCYPPLGKNSSYSTQAIPQNTDQKHPDNQFFIREGDDDTEFWLIKFPSDFDVHKLSNIKLPKNKLLSPFDDDDLCSCILPKCEKMNTENESLSSKKKEKDGKKKKDTTHEDIRLIENLDEELYNTYPLVYSEDELHWFLGPRFTRSITIGTNAAKPTLTVESGIHRPIPSEKEGLKLRTPPVGYGHEIPLISYSSVTKDKEGKLKDEFLTPSVLKHSKEKKIKKDLKELRIKEEGEAKSSENVGITKSNDNEEKVEKKHKEHNKHKDKKKKEEKRKKETEKKMKRSTTEKENEKIKDEYL